MSKLGDYITIKHGFAFKGELISKKDNGIVLVTPGNFKIGGGFQEEKCKFFLGEYSTDYVLQANDLIVTMTDLSKEGDTLGYSAKIPVSNRIYLHNQRIGLVRFKSELVDKDFLYWYMRTARYHQSVLTTSSGSTVKHTSPSRICDIEVDFPSLAIQRNIAAILNAIEDKIALNMRINENLEEQMQTLFQSRFLDYESFPATSAAWKNGLLKDVLYLKRNSVKAANKDTSLPYLPIDSIPMNTFAVYETRPNEEAKSSLIAFNQDDIIIGAMRVYFHRVIPAPFHGITRTTCLTLAPYDPDYFCFALLLCNQKSSIEYAQKTSKGSTMPYAVWDNGLGDMRINIPSKDIVAEFNRLVLPMVRKIQSSFFENKWLKETRDALLPRLMSGELDAPVAEAVTAAVPLGVASENRLDFQ